MVIPGDMDHPSVAKCKSGSNLVIGLFEEGIDALLLEKNLSSAAFLRKWQFFVFGGMLIIPMTDDLAYSFHNFAGRTLLIKNIGF